MLKTPFPHCSLLSRLNLILILSSIPSSGAGAQGMGIAISPSHMVSATPSSSQGLLPLLQCAVPPMRHSSPWTSPAWVPSMGAAVLQEQTALVQVPPSLTGSAAGLAWSQLALALSGRAPFSFSQKPLLHPLAAKTLPCKPNTALH